MRKSSSQGKHVTPCDEYITHKAIGINTEFFRNVETPFLLFFQISIVFGSFEDIVNYRPRSFSHKSLFPSRYDLRFHLNLFSPARWSHTSLSSPVQRSLIHYLPPSWTILSPPSLVPRSFNLLEVLVHHLSKVSSVKRNPYKS